MWRAIAARTRLATLVCARPLSGQTGVSQNQIIKEVADTLRTGGVPEPDLSAKYIVEEVAGHGRDLSLQLTGEQAGRLERLVSCRLARMPLQYIIGNWDFHSVTLNVRPPVFIPRPETEQLVEMVIDNLPQRETSLLEIGSGCGAISLALLNSCNNIRVTTVDVSPAACQLTLENAENLGLNLPDKLLVINDKISGDHVPAGLEQHYDMVVSNPPYVLRKDLTKLAPEIYLYEDIGALNGGHYGLDVILDIVRLASKVLGVGGKLFLEVDPCHPLILPEKLLELPPPHFSVESVQKDFNDKDRFLVLVRGE